MGERYVDSTVQAAHDEVFEGVPRGKRVPESQLAHLGQIVRSGEGFRIFEAETGHAIDSRASLIVLFGMIRENRFDLVAALRKPRLARYGKRRGRLGID